MEQEQAVLEGEQGEVVESQNTEVATEATSEPVESATTENTESDGVQKRINKLTAEKYGEKRRADALQDEIDSLKSNPSKQETEQPQGKPTLEQYDFDEGQHQAALIAYEVKQGIAENNKAAQKAQSQADQNKIDTAYDANEVKYATENPEYVNDVQNLPRFSNDTLSMIKGQENAPQLVHYLAKNPDQAHNIASLNLSNAGVQIGIVLAKLSAQTKQNVQSSTASDPIEPINSGGSIATDDKGPTGATYE
jgi:hypothetical protein